MRESMRGSGDREARGAIACNCQLAKCPPKLKKTSSSHRPAMLAAALLLVPQLSLAASRPNLVHIVIDDLGFHDVGYKDPEIISPNIDALRAQGVELGRFFSAKWCAPARGSMQTGRYPWRNGYYTQPSSQAVPLATPLLPEVLHSSGYRSAQRPPSVQPVLVTYKRYLALALACFSPTFAAPRPERTPSVSGILALS